MPQDHKTVDVQMDSKKENGFRGIFCNLRASLEAFGQEIATLTRLFCHTGDSYCGK